MGKQLRHPPVYFVIGQVRFNAVSQSIQDKITDIQERFRRLGYTDYRRQTLNQMEILVQENQVTNKLGAPVEIFDFANADRNELFRLEANQLSLHTVNYHTFGTFLQRFAEALKILTAYTPLAHVDRVGLRFLNAVMCQKGAKVDEYLHPQLWGFSTLTDGLDFEYGGTEALMHSKEGDSILARVVIQQGRVGFPVDLSNTGLEIAERFRNYVGQLAILDSDAFCSKRVTFQDESTVGGIVETLRRLKVLIDLVFKNSATERAFSIWKGEE